MSLFTTKEARYCAVRTMSAKEEPVAQKMSAKEVRTMKAAELVGIFFKAPGFFEFDLLPNSSPPGCQ